MKKTFAILSALAFGLTASVVFTAPARADVLECTKQCYKVFNKRSEQEHCEDRCWASYEANRNK